MISVRVPATSANLGSGYDSIGLALKFYNVFKVRGLLPKGKYDLETVGEGSNEAQDVKSNGVIMGYEAACAEWGMEAINARPLDAGLEVSDRPPAPPAGTPVISNTDQEVGPTPAVLLSVSVSREDASTLDRLIERLVNAGVTTVYLESGLLSHTAIALREAGIAVRRA